LDNKFDVKVKNEFGEVSLSITNNGWQWTSILLRDPPNEIPLIIEALRRHLSADACPDCGESLQDHYDLGANGCPCKSHSNMK